MIFYQLSDLFLKSDIEDDILYAINQIPQTNATVIITGGIFLEINIEMMNLFHKIIQMLHKVERDVIIIPNINELNLMKSYDFKFKNTYILKPGIHKIKDYNYYVIDKTILPINSKHNNIGIIYQKINNAKIYPHDLITKAKFNICDFPYDIVMAGSIQNHQFLTKNIGYSGSLIQHSKLYPINNGYIEWDDRFIGKFVKLKLNSAYITVYAKDDTTYYVNDALYNKIKYVELRHSNISNELLQNIKDNIIAKYDRLDYVQNLDITKLHKFIPKKNKKWIINHLTFTNLFCYDSLTCDFDKLSGCCSILGNNKMGKSSIFDSIMFVLYNKSLRGVKANMINNESNNYMIKCEFTVYHKTIDRYVIIRNGTRINTSIELSLNNKIISTDIIKTYSILKPIIGNENFISCNIITKTTNDWYNIFNEYFDFDKLNNEEKLLKESQSILRNQLRKLVNIPLKTIGLSKEPTLEKLNDYIKSLQNNINEGKKYITSIKTDDENVLKKEAVLKVLNKLNNMLSFNSECDKCKNTESIILKLNNLPTNSKCSLKNTSNDILLKLKNKTNLLSSLLKYRDYRLNFDKLSSDINENNNKINDFYTKRNDILKELCCVLENSVNSLLASFVNDTIKISIDKKVIITVDDLLLEQCSLSQKFVIDLCIKMVLANVGNANFMMIDEGFGCLDMNTINNITNFFDKLNYVQNTKWTIIVTHVEHIKNITKNYTITRDNNKSYLII